MGPLGGLVLLYSTGFLRYAKLANAYASPPGAKAFGYGKGFTRFSEAQTGRDEGFLEGMAKLVRRHSWALVRAG